MDIKDAEYLEWKEYDFNKPKTSSFTKKPLDNTKVIAEDWWLKPMMQKASVFCYNQDKYIEDYKSTNQDVRVVGTELQIYNLFCKMLDKHGWQIKDNWAAELKEEYIDWYNHNNCEPLILNLI